MDEEFQAGGGRRPSTLTEGEEAAPGVAGERTPETPTQAVKQQAGAMWDETRANVRSALRDRQQAAAAGMGDIAGALRNAAHDLDDKQKASIARVIERAAESLDRLSGTMRSKDLDSMVSEAEDFARREPGLFFGAAVAAGFLAMRFLKSSSSRAHAERGTTAMPTGRPESGHLH